MLSRYGRLIGSAALVVILGAATVIAWDGGEVRNAAGMPDGAATFQTRGCSGCHIAGGIASGNSVGPVLTNLGKRAGDRISGLTAEAYVIQSIRSPQAFTVPGYQLEMPTIDLSDDEIDALVTFLLDDQ